MSSTSSREPSRLIISIRRRSRCSSAASSSSVGRWSLYREAKICVLPSGSAYQTTASLLSAQSTIPIGGFSSGAVSSRW